MKLEQIKTQFIAEVKSKGYTVKRACELSGKNEGNVSSMLNGNRSLKVDYLNALLEVIGSEKRLITKVELI